MKDFENGVQFWVEKTLVKGRHDRIEGERSLGKALWSPQKDKRGADIYKNMRLIKEGDIILHLVDNRYFLGSSLASSKYEETNGIEGTDWDGPAFLIPLKSYKEFDKPINRQAILNESNRNVLESISNSSEVFYNSKLELRQGAYLTPCPLELFELITNSKKNKSADTQIKFEYQQFSENLQQSGLLFSSKVVVRFISSLLTKPFVILTGLSGSGKTKLAQSFVQWICQDSNQYCIVPVGADWTNREPLLGFPNALNNKEYVKPDNGILDLILRAASHINLPFFLILDEMNLSHVERYFADFLSVMESKDEILLHSNKEESDNGVPNKVAMPPNLFIIGTVNIDETTYMFSPKVLDRANTIEFRIDEKELSDFMNDNKPIDMNLLKSKGANMAVDFLSYSKTISAKIDKELNRVLIDFFIELKKTGAEFGYRTANEIQILIEQLGTIEKSLNDNQKLDIAIMQKLLPKLHGSRRKLEPILFTLGKMCLIHDIKDEDFKKQYFSNTVNEYATNSDIKFPLSLEKICRMHQSAIDHGFASYAEA